MFLLSDLDESLEFVEAESCQQALACDADSCDLILLDYHLPGVDGLEAMAAIHQRFAGATIVVVSGEDHAQTIRAAIEAGASGFIPKSSTPEVLVAALKLILAGGVYLPPMLMNGPASAVDDSQAAGSKGKHGLSSRQLQVLLKVIQGKANKVVARDLNISEGTVKAHLSAAFRTLGVHSRTEAILAAARLGITADD